MNVRKASLSRLVFMAVLIAGSCSGWSQAQDSGAKCSVRIATGPKDKVYAKMGKDVVDVCAADVNVCPVPSVGGLQNLDQMARNLAEVGFVQIDVLKEMANGDENIKGFQVVMPLHTNLLHVLAADSGAKRAAGWGGLLADKVVIRNFSELKGFMVAAVGSAQLVGQKLEAQLGYGMKFVAADSDGQALQLLKDRKVDAVFTLAGWPLESVSQLKAGQGIHLVQYDLEPRAPYVASKRNYPNLDAYNVKFLGVPNVLVARPFKTGLMAAKLDALRACLRNRLDELQERYNPAWKEIKDVEERYGLPGLPGLPARAKTVAR